MVHAKKTTKRRIGSFGLLSASERAAWVRVLSIVAETVPHFQCRFSQQEMAGALMYRCRCMLAAVENSARGRDHTASSARALCHEIAAQIQFS